MERERSQDSTAPGSAVLDRAGLRGPSNGGFPEPPAGISARVVKVDHEACGHSTRVRLPSPVPAAAVRRVVCRACSEPFIVDGGRDVERPDAPAWPGGALWRWLSIPLAGAAVIAALVLIQGGEEDPTPFADTEAPTAAAAGPAGDRRGARAGGKGDASLVRESSFSLALPQGWERVIPSGGATFAASAAAGDADATLWVERDRELSFSGFEARSLDQLEALAGSARVIEQIPAPTPEGTVVRLAADAPPGSPVYEVTLRASGPYRYYLATTVQPDASDGAVEGAELVHGSFVPAGAEDGEG